MQEKIELLEEMRTAEPSVSRGLGVSNNDAHSQILGDSSKMKSGLVTFSVSKKLEYRVR